MLKMKNVISWIKNNFEFFIIIVLCILTAVIVVNAFSLRIHFYLLSENQILYIFSVIAQIVAALSGLCFAVYGVIDFKKKVKNKDNKEIRLKENSSLLGKAKNLLFEKIKLLMIVGIIDIVLCVVSLSLYRIRIEVPFDIISSESVICFFAFLCILLKLFIDLPNMANRLAEMVIYPSGGGVVGSGERDVSNGNPNSSNKNNGNTIEGDEKLINKHTASDFFERMVKIKVLIKNIACGVVDYQLYSDEVNINDAISILRSKNIMNAVMYDDLLTLAEYNESLCQLSSSNIEINHQIYLKIENLCLALEEVLKKVDKSYEKENSKEAVEVNLRFPDEFYARIKEAVADDIRSNNFKTWKPIRPPHLGAALNDKSVEMLVKESELVGKDIYTVTAEINDENGEVLIKDSKGELRRLTMNPTKMRGVGKSRKDKKRKIEYKDKK